MIARGRCCSGAGYNSATMARANGVKTAVANPWTTRNTVRTSKLDTNGYTKGGNAKAKTPTSIKRDRFTKSDNAPTGSFKRTPVMVEAATMNPTVTGPAPNVSANGAKAGMRTRL